MMQNNSDITVAVTGQSLIKRDIRKPYNPQFEKLCRILQQADISFTNYEGTIQGKHGGWPMKNTFVHASEPKVFEVLKAIGLNTLSLANNHAFDLGPGGILSTLELTAKLDFLSAGIGRDRTLAAQPGQMTKAGQLVSLIAIDCSPVPDCFTALDKGHYNESRPGINHIRMRETLMMPQALKNELLEYSRLIGETRRNKAYQQVGFRSGQTGANCFFGLNLKAGETSSEFRELIPEDVAFQLQIIQNAAKDGNFVIVSFHHHYWEPEWDQPPVWVQNFFRTCIDHGARLVIGHGVPLLQGIEIYKNQPIFYSTGNFIFHTFRQTTYQNDALWKSVVASCHFNAKQEIQTIQLFPVIIGGETALKNHHLTRDVPLSVQGNAATEIISKLSELSAPYGTTISSIGDSVVIHGIE